jgi:flagellin-like hook-associated protein FlgL
MAVINTNYKALFGQAALKGTERSLQTAMQQLSTGKRINSAKDDAAGMAISTRMTQQIRALNQSVRNAGDAVSLIQTVEGATNAITDMLQRMRELAIQAINDTNANDQRSYLDLEFQQLKKEIVRISDMTEWNGFPVLNGSAGERVGERPVYKITSDSQFLSGLTYSGASGATTLTSGTVTTSATWTAAGNLQVKMSGATVGSASFTLLDGTSFDITSAVTATGAVLSISKDVLSTAGYQFLGSDAILSQSLSGTATNFSGQTIRQTVARTYFELDQIEANDLFVNGVNIDSTAEADDGTSYSNKAGSAIAKAAVINAASASTGVTAVVNPTIMTGSAMKKTDIDPVTGTLTINGIVTARITTIEDNPRASRAAAVEAINAATSLTGVVAIDTGYDNQGIRLEAVDGRNIELSFNTAVSSSEFAAATGLKEGIQSGTYSLESSVEGDIVLTSSTTGNLQRSGFTNNTVFDNAISPDYLKGDYSDNVSRYITGARDLVSVATNVKPLTISDVMINGVAIRASVDEDDKVSLDTGTSDRASSAIAIAAAINSHYSSTGVRATAAEAVSVGTSTATEVAATTNSTTKTLYVNGVGIDVVFDPTETDSQRRENVMAAINTQTPNTGVYARDTGSGGITLATSDGRNLSVWFNTNEDGDTVTAAEFGLGGAPGVYGGTGLTDASAPTLTVYGSVTLSSEKEFKVEPGGDGFTTDSNFTALGFKQGTYGGEVNSAEGKMSPPRTGRLAFQVGASEGQLITIDLADFGKGGPITGAITKDVDDPGTVTAVGNLTTTVALSGKQSLFINGVEIEVMFNNPNPSNPNAALAERRAIMINAINAASVDTNVRAADNGTGITLTNLNGSNIAVWYDSDKVSSATEFGLGGADGVSGVPDANASYQGAKILYPETNNIRSGAHATSVLSKLDKVMDKVNANRANMGAVMNRLQYAMDNLSNVSTNTSASRSQIEDADYAAASTELAKTQIMQQAATAVLAQANTSQQSVLKLLNG